MSPLSSQAAKPFTDLERQRYIIVESDPLKSRKAALAGAFQDRATDEFYTVCGCLFERVSASSSDEHFDENLVAQAHHLFDTLEFLGWTERSSSLLYGTLRVSLLKVLNQQVQDTIQGDFCTPCFDNIIQLTTHILSPLHLDPTTLSHAAATAFLQARSKNELFDIITQYPDSVQAVDELALAMADDADRQANLARHCRAQLIRRLCHTGAETTAILDVYMNTIHVVRRWDPSDVLLRTIAAPVRAYLRGRQDTVRCILQNLTDQSLSLYQELRRGEPIDAALLDTVAEPTMEWQPEPSIQKPQGAFLQGTKNGSGKDADILAMLVSIYGSKVGIGNLRWRNLVRSKHPLSMLVSLFFMFRNYL